MAYVVLNATKSSDAYPRGQYTIVEQKYKPCLLFKRYEHRPTRGFTAVDIFIYEKYTYFGDNYVTLRPGISNRPYQTAKLDKAHVYYNKYENKTPLLLVLFFKVDQTLKSRYYVRSRFKNDIKERRRKGIDNLTPLESDDIENELLKPLIEENDGLTHYITYHIDRKTPEEYKNTSIKIVKEDHKPTSGFTKYTHTPTTSDCKNRASVLNDKKVLSWFRSKRFGLVEITEVQNIVICNMEVYYSTKIKEPLMIHLHIKNSSEYKRVYYFQKLITGGLFWQVLDHPSFNYLLHQSLGSNDIHTKLTDSGNKLLSLALKEIESYMTKIIVIMVDKTTKYTNADVTKAFESTLFDTERSRIMNYLGEIGVNNSSACKLPSDNNYTVREHDINAISKTLVSGECLKLTLIRSLQNISSGKSSILTINIDYQFRFGSYYSQTHLIQVTDSFNPNHKYKWYKHSCEYEIIDGTFQILFDGQYLTLEGDLGNSSHNKAVIAYFHYDYPDRFIFVVFPDKEFKNIWYLTYSKFVEMVKSRNTVKLTTLNNMSADTSRKLLDGGHGYKIDSSLLAELNKECRQLESDRLHSINVLDYVKYQNKLYIYSSTTTSQILMICYADKAYKRYYLGTKSSTWKPIDGETKCVCNDQVDSFVETLNSINVLYGLTDPNKLTDQKESEKTITINISKKGPSKYHNSAVNVTEKQIHSICRLFLYYKHSLTSGRTLDISSVKVTNPENKTINLSVEVSKAVSVTVYFNKFISSKPLALCIETSHQQKYYKNIIRPQTTYTISEDSTISSKNLVDKLITENDNISDLLTYQVDITKDKGSETYNDGKIRLGRHENEPSPGYTKYTHTPVAVHSKHKACVLYNRQVLLTKNIYETPFISLEIKQIQYVSICSMTVYYSNKIKGPLMIDIHIKDSTIDKHLYYFQKKHDKFIFWQLFNTASSYELMGERIVKDIHKKLTSDKNKLIKALENIEIYLSKILVIILDSKTDYSGEDVTKIIKGEAFYNNYSRIANNYGNITVSNITSSSCKNLIDEGYSVYEHDLSKISKSIQSEEYIRMLFVGSAIEISHKDENMITIDLDFQHEGGGYYSQSNYISVSNAHSIKHMYKWYKHNCEQNITDRTFKLHFNGQHLKIEGDSSDSDLSRNIVLVYFEYLYRDSFILVAFPSLGFNKIVYLTYDIFMENILSGRTIKISELKQMTADVKTTFIPGESGYKIDSPILAELKEQYRNIQSDNNRTINSLLYQKSKDKFYIYTSSDGSKILMICYAGKAYKRYFLAPDRSSWKPVDGVNKCICRNNFDLKDASNKKLLESLNYIATLQGLIDPKKITEEDESQKPIIIDISKTGPNNYGSNSVTVTKQTVFDNSNLFLHYTHAPTNGGTFEISSLKAGIPQNKNITLDSPLENVKSVNVYFSVIPTSKPIILEIVLSDLKKKYFTNLIQSKQDYTITENANISFKFLEQLLNENEIKNNTFAYHIDKTIDSGYEIRYGYNDSIKVKQQSNDGFTSYTHQPTKLKSNKAYVLYRNKLLVGRSRGKIEDLKGIHNKTYNSIKVYVYDNDKSLPLLIELKEQEKTTYYSHKKDSNGLYWFIESDFKGDNIKSKLDFLFYLLKSSAIIEIDKGLDSSHKGHHTYPIKLIDNEVDGAGQSIVTKYNQAKELTSKSINISTPSQIIYSSSNTGFYYVNHEIKNVNLSADDKKSIGGIRLFIVKSGEADPVELKLFSNAVGHKDRFYLYYKVGEQTKIVVYFYREDKRPLAICVNNKLYKPLNYTTDQWVFVKQANCFKSTEILQTLNSVYLGMKNQLTFVSQGKFQHITSVTQKTKDYMKDIYTPDYVKSSNGPYNLTKNTLTSGISDDSILGKLLDSIINHKFDKVTKYYKDNSKPLAFEFTHESTTLNFVRIDDTKYWLKESVKLESEIQRIETDAKQTIVYEVDETNENYNSNIGLKSENDQPTTGFKKYVHTPKGDKWKKSLFLYKGDKLMTRGNSENFIELKEINKETYNNVTVYCGTKAKGGNNGHPLIFELNKTDNNKSFYGIKFQNSSYYWETLSIPQNDPQNKELITKLREYELELAESVIILTDKCFNSTYGDSDILNAIGKLKSSTKINSAKIGSNTVKVSDKTDIDGNCIRKYGFKLCEHDLSSYFTGDKNCALRFFILTNNYPDNYNEIKLYDSTDVIDTLYYDKKGNGIKDKVHICLYGEDPRPLLLIYNGNAYKPCSLTHYENKWVKEKTVTSLCKQADDKNLVNTLSEIAKFLNVVQLDKRPVISNREDEKPNTEGMIHHKYSVQKFKGKDIEIKVTYENKKCYRVYKHVPNGIDGLGEKYRLGNITNNSETRTGIDYNPSKQLRKVLLYYNVYDQHHDYPFLVELEFKKNGMKDVDKGFYKLKTKSEKEWEEIQDKDDFKEILSKLKNSDKFEDGLYDLRKKLEINFEDKDKIRPLFKTDLCKEDNIDLATYVGAPLGTAAGVGTIVTISVVVFKKLATAAVTASAAT